MISIVIPTIGSCPKNYFEEAINSAFTIENDLVTQIIIINNSQNEEFTNFLNSNYSSKDKVEIIQVPSRLPMGESWNEGLKQVFNPWHLYLHDDDILTGEINNISKEILKDSLGFISYDCYTLEGSKKSPLVRRSGLEGIIENTPKFVSTLINTQALRDLSGWDDKASYFLDLQAFILLDQKYGSSHYNKPFGLYRIHAGAASNVSKRMETYGEALPYVLSRCFEVVKESDMRRKLLWHTVSFAYPKVSTVSKVFGKLLSVFGKKAWISN